MKKRSSHSFFFFSAFSFLFFVGVVKADVFSLWPSSGKSGATGGELNQVLNGKIIMSEPVSVNGIDGIMEMSLLELELPRCRDLLKNRFPNAIFRANQNSLLVETTRADGSRQRLFLIQLGGDYPALQFSMNLPAKNPERFEWPSELPLPPGAKPNSSMRFSKRNSCFGDFTTNLSPEHVYDVIENELVSKGWRKVGGKNSRNASATAGSEIYLRKSPLSVFVVHCQRQKNGSTRACLYLKPPQQ